MQLMLLSKSAIQAVLQSRPQQYEAIQEKAKALYEAHISRSRHCNADLLQFQDLDSLNDASVAMLRSSLSMSHDIHIRDVAGNSSANPEVIEGEGVRRQDTLLGNRNLPGIPNAPSRPENDRPRTFD
jgi:hypothetical protein